MPYRDLENPEVIKSDLDRMTKYNASLIEANIELQQKLKRLHEDTHKFKIFSFLRYTGLIIGVFLCGFIFATNINTILPEAGTSYSAEPKKVYIAVALAIGFSVMAYNYARDGRSVND